jgi:Squalene-hopene cyclase N-terminal domain
MLIERDLGDKAKASRWRQALIEQQNKDGGWGLVRNDPSHIVVTGQVLYALGIDGVGKDEDVVRRVWTYLLATQGANGSWTAPSRVVADHRNYVTDNFGTAWATLGLLRTLPAERRK